MPGLRGPRSFGIKEFDPFWRRVCETGVLVVMHVSDSGYSRFGNEWRGQASSCPSTRRRFCAYWTHAHVPMADALASLACQGTLARFPDLRIYSVENGAHWVPSTLSALADTFKKMPQLFAEEPGAAIRRCLYINPFWEDNVLKLAGHVPLDHIVFGSDYPHPEGLRVPLSYVDELAALTDEQKAMVMGGTVRLAKADA